MKYYTKINNIQYEIKNTNLINIYKDFKTIENRNDLIKRNLTLAEFHLVGSILQILIINKKMDNAYLTESTKKYLLKYNIKVNEKIKNVNYIIEV